MSLQCISQTQAIKVKKATGQSESPWHVTICGMYRGDVRSEDLYKDNRLKIADNTISLEIRNRILLADKRTKIYIDDIKAVSKYKDTIFLNPITLKVIE